MVTAITHNIRVSVQVIYQAAYSRPVKQEYVFAYRITIENLGLNTVQLLRRHWHIWDSLGLWREVEGEGVVGEQPILEMGDTHQYTSGCPLISDMGYMYGTFKMIRLDDHSQFEVEVPKFQFITPFKGN